MIDTRDDRFSAVAEAVAALGGVERACKATLDPAIVELCRRRVALLLGNEVELVRAPAEPGAGLADSGPAARACLAFTEEFVIDVTRIDDGTVEALAAHMSPLAIYIFARWLQACEARQRVELLLRHDPELAALCEASSMAALSGLR